MASGGLRWGSKKALARGLPGEGMPMAATCLIPSVEHGYNKQADKAVSQALP